MLAQSSQTITPLGAVLGIINGMIGSIALMLPSLALSAGYIASAISIVITGVSCSFSSWIYFQHLGEEPDIGFALMKHFKGNFWAKSLYNVSAWLFLIMACIQYFQWIVEIWDHVLNNQYSYERIIIAAANGCAILAFVILLKYWQYGAKAMIYGVISIAVYMIFLLQALVNSLDSKESIRQYNAFDKGQFLFAAAMSQAFMIQVFLVPFLLKLKKQRQSAKNFLFYTLLSYFIGGFIYGYIAQVGSFGILHRQSKQTSKDYGILAFFDPSVGLDIICFIYTIHMYSVFPQFLLISKKIFFETFQKLGLNQTSKKQINRQQVIYLASIVLISVIIGIFDEVEVYYLSVINGGIVGCLIIYIIPSFLHLYCMYYIPQQFREPFSTEEDVHRNSIQNNPNKKQNVFYSLTSNLAHSQLSVQHIYVQCNCKHYKKSASFKAFITILLIFMSLFGVLVSIGSIRDTFN